MDFFNILTLGLCLAVLPDSTWHLKINWLEATAVPDAAALIPALILAPASVFWLFKTLF